MESILTTIKKMLGIAEEHKDFDPDIIAHINTEFMVLHQIGVGPSEVFKIEDDLALWTDFTEDIEQIEGVKQYIYIRVKAVFDPPTGAASDAHTRKSEELEWRLNFAAESEVL